MIFWFLIIFVYIYFFLILGISFLGFYIVIIFEWGILFWIWDILRGRLERELWRGVDLVEMWGVIFECDGKGVRVVGWSDKGIIYVWGGDESKIG